MTDRLSGVNLPNGDDYAPWNAALSENYVNVEDGLGSAIEMWDAGSLPFVHLMFHDDRQPDCSIQKIAAGEYDDVLGRWLDGVKAYCDTGRKLVVVYLPEMNGNWCGAYATDDYSSESFKQAFRRFVQMGRARGLDETMVLWSFAPNDTGWETLADWFPGDVVVDIIGSSAYNWGGIFEGEPWELFTELADRYVREVRQFTDRPIVITQTGAGMNPHTDEQLAWLTDMVHYVNEYQNIEGVIYYNELMFEYLPGQESFNEIMAPLNHERPDHWFTKQEVPMREHTAMQWLPDALRSAGVNVVELDGWKEAQGDYFWTDIDISTGHQTNDGEPTCFMVHHTATASATPVVKNSSGKWSKANVWVGLWRDGRLYQTGGGVPTVVFTSAGPARVSSGYGHEPTLRDVAADIRVPYDQPNDDIGMAANRYAWNAETVAKGDGSDIDAGVQHALIVMGALMGERFGWSPWRTIGHLTWTGRKIDPFWGGKRDVIVEIQDAVAEYMNGGPVAPPTNPPTEPGDTVDTGRNMQYVQEGDSGFEVEYWQVRIIEAIKGVKFYGNSNKAFVEAEASALEFKTWDDTMTNYLSSFTGRRSYGIGPTERVMVENAMLALYS